MPAALTWRTCYVVQYLHHYSHNCYCSLTHLISPPDPWLVCACSIGSLGQEGTLGCISNVQVNNVHMFGSLNGLRIKTYQGGKGQVSGVQYSNVFMTNVFNPIVITQVRPVCVCVCARARACVCTL